MATQVLCAWCEAERRAVPGEELERLEVRRPSLETVYLALIEDETSE